MTLAGNVAVVTSASRGIGKARATALLTSCAALVLAARRRDAIGDVTDAVRKDGGTGLAIALRRD